MLIRIVPFKDDASTNLREVFIPLERIWSVAKHEAYDGEISYIIDSETCAYRIDRESYERIVNQQMTFDSETGVMKWDFFDDKDVKQNVQEG